MSHDHVKWVSAATAPGRMLAEMWCDLLHNEGIPAFAKVIDIATVAVSDGLTVSVMVPEERLKEALLVLEGGDGHSGKRQRAK